MLKKKQFDLFKMNRDSGLASDRCVLFYFGSWIDELGDDQSLRILKDLRHPSQSAHPMKNFTSRKMFGVVE